MQEKWLPKVKKTNIPMIWVLFNFFYCQRCFKNKKINPRRY